MPHPDFMENCEMVEQIMRDIELQAEIDRLKAAAALIAKNVCETAAGNDTILSD
jgi:hypothetical protein